MKLPNAKRAIVEREKIADYLLNTPSGKTPTVRTVWIVDCGVEMPRIYSTI